MPQGYDASLELQASGEGFRPSQVQAAIPGFCFTSSREAGEVASIGRYKGRPHPVGTATLVLQEHVDPADALEALEPTDRLKEIVDACKNFGAEVSLVMNIGFSAQCNFLLDEEDLARLHAVGVALAVSCYPADEGTGGGGTTA